MRLGAGPPLALRLPTNATFAGGTMDRDDGSLPIEGTLDQDPFL